MVIGYHLVWTAYGWWLPNDPRGSGSHELRVKKIGDLGPIHEGRKRVQPKSAEIRRFYRDASLLLNHDLLTFTAKEVQEIAVAFAEVVRENKYTCYACAIMPDHVHLLIRRHRDRAEDMIANFQEASRNRLIATRFRAEDHPVWGGPGWKGFLDTPGYGARRALHRAEPAEDQTSGAGLAVRVHL